MTPRPTPRLGRAGFTLVETVLALAIVGMISLGAWAMTDSVRKAQTTAVTDEDARQGVLHADIALRGALRESSAGVLSSPNVGPVHVVTATVAGVRADTLVVLRGDAPAVAVSSRACPSGGSCILLVGDHRNSFRTGDVVLLATPSVGGRVYQVSAQPQVRTDACGADCPEVLDCPTFTAVAVPATTELVTSYYYPNSVATPLVRPGIPCSQSYYINGDRCVEERGPVTPPARRRWSCTASGPVQRFTELPVADRTAAPMRFPTPDPVPTRSGAGLTPRVRVQRVIPSRFWIRGAGTAQATLVRQNGLTAGGEWRPAFPLAGRVSSLAVQTMHGGDFTWRSGIGVAASELARSSSNTNFASNPPGIAPEPGYVFDRGYHTISGVRARYTVRTQQQDGTIANVPYATLVATNTVAGGGAEGGQ